MEGLCVRVGGQLGVGEDAISQPGSWDMDTSPMVGVT